MTDQKHAATKSTTSRKSANPSSDDTPQYGPPLKPRPILFVVLWIVLVLWLSALVVMRLRTVKPAAIVHTEPAPVVSR